MQEAVGSLSVVLEQRSHTHGSFADNADIAIATRELWRATANWQRLRPTQRLALEEIALKVARILSEGSDPDNNEHWMDGAGYFFKGAE